MNLLYMFANEALFKPYTESDLPHFSKDFIREDCLLRLEELSRDFDMSVVLADSWAEHRIVKDIDPYYRVHRVLRNAFDERRITEASDNFICRGKYAPIKDISDNPCVKSYLNKAYNDTFLYCATLSHRKDPEMEDHCITITSKYGLSMPAFKRIYDIFDRNKSSRAG